MAFDDTYKRQAELMVLCLGWLDEADVFALKGGTAINLFYHAMPRLSVDIDPAFLKVGSRNEAYQQINETMEKYREKLIGRGLDAIMSYGKDEGQLKLIVRRNGVSVKIEPNYNLRGALYPAEERRMVKEAVEFFGREVIFRSLDYREVMAGKLSAFLDRQTPRDIFDMGQFMKSGRKMDEIIDVAVVYIAQSKGMISHVLEPHLLDKEMDFLENFRGMTNVLIEYKELAATRNNVLQAMKIALKSRHSEFLVSVMESNPDWSKLTFGNRSDLPGIQWKIKNSAKMIPMNRLKEIAEIRRIIEEKREIGRK